MPIGTLNLQQTCSMPLSHQPLLSLSRLQDIGLDLPLLLPEILEERGEINQKILSAQRQAEENPGLVQFPQPLPKLVVRVSGLGQPGYL